MSDVVAKATLEVAADVSGAVAGLREAERGVRSLEATTAKSGKNAADNLRGVGAAAGESGERVAAAGRRLLSQLEREASQIGKTRLEWLEYRAAQLGVGQAAGQYLAKLREAEEQTRKNAAASAQAAAALRATDAQFSRSGMSAAQTAAALRMVPAQFTDIATQLAGGQNAMLVLLQQGGQLKDMFGGIGPAARVMGGYIAGLISPFTLAATAAGVFGAAILAGHNETVQLNRALVLTGNYAGITAASFEATARTIADSTDRGIGAARDVLQELVKSGRLGGEALTVLGQAAVTMADLTGDSLAEIARDYAKMPEGVAKWAAEHNKSLHYITLAQYEYIKSLEEQGRTQEAVLENAKLLHAHLSGKGVETLGYLERAWRGVGNAISEAWNALKSFGRETAAPGSEVVNERRNDLLRRAGAARGRGDLDTARRLEEEAKRAEAAMQSLEIEERRLAEAAARNRRQQAEAISASEKLDQIDERTNKTKALNKALEENRRLEASIRAVNPNDERISAAAIAAREAETRKRFSDRGAASAVQNALGGDIEALRGQARQREQLARQEQATLEKLRAADFFSQEEFIRRSFEAKRAALQDQVKLAEREAQLAGGRQSLAERQRYASQVKELQAQISATYQEEAAEVEKYQERIRGAVAQTALQLKNYAATRDLQNQRQLGALGMGDQARQLVDTLNQVQDQYRRFQDQFTENIRRTGGANALDTDAYRQQIAAIQAEMEAQLARERGMFEERQRMQADWSLGARRALENYRDAAANIAESTGRVFGSTFQGLEDAVAKFVTTGKLSFGDFARSVIADLARIQARAAVSGLLQMGVSLVGSMFAAGAGAASSAGSAWNGFSTGPAAAGAGYSGISAGGTFGNGLSGVFVSGARASGGPVEAGKTYLVGEKGPELFTAPRTGHIVPNHALGGGGVVVNVHNAPPGTEVRESQGPDGTAQIDVLLKQVDQRVDQRMARNMTRQGGYASQIRNGTI